MAIPSFRSLLWSSLLVAGAIAVGVTPARTQTLPLADNLISLTSPDGQTLLRESEAQADYIALASHFVTQQNPAFCGIASAVTILNAMEIAAPLATEWNRNYFTQENFFNPETEAIIPRTTISRQGLTLAELTALFESHGARAERVHGADLSLDEFRQRLAENLAEPGNYVVANYLRRAIAQERGGHISPIAAYDAESDRFLILDVSRYKYPPVWVRAQELWEATRTVDSVSGKTRGIVLVSQQNSAQ